MLPFFSQHCFFYTLEKFLIPPNQPAGQLSYYFYSDDIFILHLSNSNIYIYIHIIIYNYAIPFLFL